MLPLSAAPACLPASATPEKPGTYRAGTLAYTRWGLVVLCTWLLWGDVFFSLFEIVQIKILPLQLKGMLAPDWVIGMAAVTIPGAIRLVVGPIISVRSDRCRSRWGRRRPFLLLATPFVAAAMVALGFAPEICARLQGPLAAWFSPMAVTIGTLVALVVAYNFFNAFIATLYIYLFNDVVPQRFMATFMGIFRFISVLVGAGFGVFLFPLADNHTREIYCGSAVLLLIMFGTMVLRVREGDYPPPKPLMGSRTGPVAAIRTYCVECFTSRRYWYYFLAAAFWAMGFSITSFDVFLAQSLGVSKAQYGWMLGITHVLIAALIIPAGVVADRIHPLRVMLLSKMALLVVTPAYLLFLCYNEAPPWAYGVWIALQLMTVPLTALYKAAEMPMSMRILPQDRFGQFSSAAEVVKSLGLMAGGVLAGVFLGCMEGLRPAAMWHYRAVPLWMTLFYGLSLLFLVLLYRDLRRDPDGGLAPVRPAPDR